jgi:hypothetical protein
MKNIVRSIIGLLLGTILVSASAQDSPSYKDGPVIYVSYIKTKPGRFDDYMAFLDSQYKKVMTEQKKAGIILDFRVFGAQPRHPTEPDIILTVTYPNMAALDRSDDADAVAAKVVGTPAKQAQLTQEREALRTVLGGELIREMVLK